MALEIRPPAGNAGANGTKSSAAKSSSSELFSLTAGSKPAAKSADSSGNKSSAKADSRSTAAKSSAGGKSGGSGKSAAGHSAGGSASAHSGKGAADQSHDPNSTADTTSANTNPDSNGAARSRATARGAATKANAGGANGAQANNQADAATDPTTDSSNSAGRSLLQLLAQSLEGDASASPSSDATATTGTADKSTDDSTSANDNANALTLAMFTQALAAALGAAPQSPGIAANAAPPDSSAAQGITDATRSSGGSVQELLSLMAQSVAADSKGNSDADAAQSNVTTASTPSGDTSTANTAAAGPNSIAHLGVASHFSLQHARGDSNTGGDLKSPVGTPAWNDELGGQLTWMTQQGLESGSLRVSPEHLGPVEVKISVQNGDASVWFGASHPDTRAALEQALPRLREMFASQGMTLTDSGVRRDPPRNQTRSSASQDVASVSASGASSSPAAVRMSLGLVDTYA